MFNELAEKRRSVKIYAERPVEAKKIDAIVEAALRSPTGAARRPWAFVVVTDKTLLKKLSVAKPMGAPLSRMPRLPWSYAETHPLPNCGLRIAPSLRSPCSMRPMHSVLEAAGRT